MMKCILNALVLGLLTSSTLGFLRLSDDEYELRVLKKSEQEATPPVQTPTPSVPPPTPPPVPPPPPPPPPNDNGGGAILFQWPLQVDSPGRYSLDFYYTNGGSSFSDPATVIVDCAVADVVDFVPSGDWGLSISNPVHVSLIAGLHDVRIYATQGLSVTEVTATFVSDDATAPENQIVNNCIVIGAQELDATSSNDASTRIQQALNIMLPNDALLLLGNFLVSRTIYLPSNIIWRLHGTMTLEANTAQLLDLVGGHPVLITQVPQGATNIYMEGGTYYGNQGANVMPGDVRLLNFLSVTYSIFVNMIVEDASDDNFSLGKDAQYNEVHNVISRYAGGNGLSDKGRYNKWFDCIAELSNSDGWTCKCSNSEFYRCIARENNGPGFGMYARQDIQSVDIGALINGNLFYETQAYCNARSGMSFNIADNSGSGAQFINNFVQGVFYKNSLGGVLFRNRQPDGVIMDNTVDIIAIYNSYNGSQGLSFGKGFHVEVGGGSDPTSPVAATGFTGIFLGYSADNGGLDVNIQRTTDSTIQVYQTNPPAAVTGETITFQELNNYCPPSSDEWWIQQYCNHLSKMETHVCTNQW